MKSTVFLSLAEVLALHRALIERFGGEGGVRDRGLLESALARPRSGYYATLSLQAAALLQSLCQNHASSTATSGSPSRRPRSSSGSTASGSRSRPTTASAFLIDRAIVGRADLDEIAAWLERHLLAV